MDELDKQRNRHGCFVGSTAHRSVWQH